MATDDPRALYTDELAATVCRRMAEGESLIQICRDEAMPCKATVMKWAREIPGFADQYARAREALLEIHAEELVEIADDGTNDWMERATRDGRIERVLDREHIDRSRLRVDTRKWLLSKLLPKKYGDKLQLDGTLNHKHDVDSATDAQLEAIARGGSPTSAEPQTGED
jgi:hypothetical protein